MAPEQPMDFQRTMVEVKVQLLGDVYKDLLQERKETLHLQRINDLQAQIMVCKDWSEHTLNWAGDAQGIISDVNV